MTKSFKIQEEITCTSFRDSIRSLYSIWSDESNHNDTNTRTVRFWDGKTLSFATCPAAVNYFSSFTSLRFILVVYRRTNFHQKAFKVCHCVFSNVLLKSRGKCLTLFLTSMAEHWRGTPIILWGFQVTDQALQNNHCKCIDSTLTDVISNLRPCW